MYQALSCFTIQQATGSWARAWERGYNKLLPILSLDPRAFLQCEKESGEKPVSAFISTSLSILVTVLPNYGRWMLKSVRGSLLKILHTEGPHTLGKVVSHTGDAHVNMVYYTEGPQTPGKLSAIQGVLIFPSSRVPNFLGIYRDLAPQLSLEYGGPGVPLYWEYGSQGPGPIFT